MGPGGVRRPVMKARGRSEHVARINARARPPIEEPRGRRQRPPEGGAPGPGGGGSLLFTVVASL